MAMADLPDIGLLVFGWWLVLGPLKFNNFHLVKRLGTGIGLKLRLLVLG